MHDASGSFPNDMAAITVHNQIALHQTEAWRMFARAVQFYQIDKTPISEVRRKYDLLFKKETGFSIIDYVIGGMCCVLHQAMVSHEQLCVGWKAIPRPDECKSEKEVEVLEAFASCRVGAVAKIRADILHFEEGNLPRDFNLIALSRFPIVNLAGQYFILNLSALGRSLSDGPRHVILTAAVQGGNRESRRVGGIYGEIFEDYVLGFLGNQFADRMVPLPASSKRRGADCLILFPDTVVVVEIKSERFTSKKHYKLLDREQRIRQIRKTGVDRSVDQICSTIQTLRRGEFARTLKIPRYDWTITPILPLILTEEEFPKPALFWDDIYNEVESPLRAMSGGAGDVLKLRLLSVDELEIVPEIRPYVDFGRILCSWANDRKGYDLTFKNFLLSNGYSIDSSSSIERVVCSYKQLAQRLGLDANAIKNPKDGLKDSEYLGRITGCTA
jgi:hypothetical protein